MKHLDLFSGIGGFADTACQQAGVPGRVVQLPDGTTISKPKWRKEALKAYGNAIVPQVAMEIFKAIRIAQG